MQAGFQIDCSKSRSGYNGNGIFRSVRYGLVFASPQFEGDMIHSVDGSLLLIPCHSLNPLPDGLVGSPQWVGGDKKPKSRCSHRCALVQTTILQMQPI